MSGELFIVCAPSGAGKTSLVAEVLRRDPQLKLSVSCTTRPPRPGERDGIDYRFLTREAFQAMAARGEFLESAEVHGNLYGTSQAWIQDQRRAGSDIVLEIDWQGAQQVRRQIDGTTGIFILPPSIEVLRARLKNRGKDSAEVIEARIAAARSEISHVAEFDYVMINDKFDDAVADLAGIVRAVRLQAGKQISRHETLINSYR